MIPVDRPVLPHAIDKHCAVACDLRQPRLVRPNKTVMLPEERLLVLSEVVRETSAFAEVRQRVDKQIGISRKRKVASLCCQEPTTR